MILNRNLSCVCSSKESTETHVLAVCIADRSLSFTVDFYFIFQILAVTLLPHLNVTE